LLSALRWNRCPRCTGFRRDHNGPGPLLLDKGYLHAQFTEAFERYLPA
jgi:hypothetical protein